MDGGNIYKIGIAANPESRLRELQAAHHQKLRLCFAMKTHAAQELEIKLHAAFDDRRLEGEWFDLGVGHLAQPGAMIVQRNLQGVRSMNFFR